MSAEIKFRGREVTSFAGRAACTLFVIFVTPIMLFLQPLFWLAGRRGPVYRNETTGGWNVEEKGSFDRKRNRA